MKRSFDIFFALVGLSLLAVPFVAIALATKLFSRGPVFFRQLRIGRGGKPFWLYKFRSMYVNQGGSLVTMEGDPRITPVGRVLRRWKLDELPQLWNVLTGRLSVIARVSKWSAIWPTTLLHTATARIDSRACRTITTCLPHEADPLRR